MDQRITFTHPDGSVGIITPAPEMFDETSRTRLLLKEQGITFKTAKAVLDWVAAKDVPAGLPWRVIDAAALPPDRTFREAWTDALPTPTIDVDMAKARGLHMNRLRTARDEKLKALDVPYLVALESGSKARKDEIAAKKQELRDMPLHTDLSTIQTPEELNQFVPEVLKD